MIRRLIPLLTLILDRGKLFGLADVQALTNLITGSILESAEIDTLADKYAGDIRAGNGNIDQLSRDLYDRLSSSGVKLNTFAVEHIYEPNRTGSTTCRFGIKPKASMTPWFHKSKRYA